MSTRATPAVNVVIGALPFSFGLSQPGRQLPVGLRPPLLEREPRVLARAVERRGVELGADPPVPVPSSDRASIDPSGAST